MAHDNTAAVYDVNRCPVNLTVGNYVGYERSAAVADLVGSIDHQAACMLKPGLTRVTGTVKAFKVTRASTDKALTEPESCMPKKTVDLVADIVPTHIAQNKKATVQSYKLRFSANVCGNTSFHDTVGLDNPWIMVEKHEITHVFCKVIRDFVPTDNLKPAWWICDITFLFVVE